MKVQELEEWQGITPQMVTAYLDRTGWRICALGLTKDGLGTLCDGAFAADMLPGTVGWLAEISNRTPQVILREINPRMRKGVPCEADIAAHLAAAGTSWPWPWLALDEHGNPRVGFWNKPVWKQDGPFCFYVQGRGYLTKERVKDWSFWPADRNLARVPWPASSPSP